MIRYPLTPAAILPLFGRRKYDFRSVVCLYIDMLRQMSLPNDANRRHLTVAPADSFGERTQAALYYFLMRGGGIEWVRAERWDGVGAGRWRVRRSTRPRDTVPDSDENVIFNFETWSPCRRAGSLRATIGNEFQSGEDEARASSAVAQSSRLNVRPIRRHGRRRRESESESESEFD